MSIHNFSTFENLNTLFTDLGDRLKNKLTGIELTFSEYDALPSADKEDPSKLYFVDNTKSVTWNINLDGKYIWTNNSNIYYSYGSDQYKLNGITWEPMDWIGLATFNRENIWTDGTDTYYSNGSEQYRLINDNAWSTMTWRTGLKSFYGKDVWTDGNNIYYSDGTNNYKLNNYVWESTTFTGLTNFYGHLVWTDGTDTYYSNAAISNEQCKLNGTNWEFVTWSGFMNEFNGNLIWTDGTNIYWSIGSIPNGQGKLNGTTWEIMNWTGFTDILAEYVWTDGTNIYYSKGSDQYRLDGTNWTAAIKEFDKYNSIYYKNIEYSNKTIFTSSETQANQEVVFTNLDPNYGYTLYLDTRNITGDIAIPVWTSVTKAISNNLLTLTYTINGGENGVSNYKLKISKQ